MPIKLHSYSYVNHKLLKYNIITIDSDVGIFNYADDNVNTVMYVRHRM